MSEQEREEEALFPLDTTELNVEEEDTTGVEEKQETKKRRKAQED